MAEKKNTKTDNEPKKSSSGGGVGIFTVFMIVGVTNAVVWFGVQSMNVQQLEDWGKYKDTMKNAVAKSLTDIVNQLGEKAPTKSVQTIAQISAGNVKDLVEIKGKFGNFKLGDFNRRILDLETSIGKVGEDIKSLAAKADTDKQKEEILEAFDAFKVIVDGKIGQVKPAEIDQTLEKADDKQNEVLALVDGLKEAQKALEDKIQGTGDAGAKMKDVFGDKIVAIETELDKIQVDYTDLHELALQAEGFKLWHRSVGEDLEKTVEKLMETEGTLEAEVKRLHSELGQISKFKDEMESLRQAMSERNQVQEHQMGELTKKLHDAVGTVGVQKDTIKNMDLEMKDMQKTIDELIARPIPEIQVEEPVVEAVVEEKAEEQKPETE